MPENMDLSPYRPKGTVPFSRRKSVHHDEPLAAAKIGTVPREPLRMGESWNADTELSAATPQRSIARDQRPLLFAPAHC